MIRAVSTWTIVLAAGTATRFGRLKQFATVGGNVSSSTTADSYTSASRRD